MQWRKDIVLTTFPSKFCGKHEGLVRFVHWNEFFCQISVRILAAASGE